jgi:hypothetical protein
MDYEYGFDVFPRLKSSTNRIPYEYFMRDIINGESDNEEEYSRRADHKTIQTDRTEHYMVLTVSTDAQLPYNPKHCDHFLRFSTKVKVNHAATKAAIKYVERIYEDAKQAFGPGRLLLWRHVPGIDDDKQCGHYSSEEIQEAERNLRRQPAVRWRRSFEPYVIKKVPPFIRRFAKPPLALDRATDYWQWISEDVTALLYHWCFLAEIDSVETSSQRQFWVRDADGSIVPVSIQADDKAGDLLSILKKGAIVAILYAKQHVFPHRTFGIEIQQLSTVKVMHQIRSAGHQ